MSYSTISIRDPEASSASLKVGKLDEVGDRSNVTKDCPGNRDSSDGNDNMVHWNPHEHGYVKRPSRTKLRSFTTKTHVQQLQFITFQEPSEMRDGHNRRLAHVHSVKENTRKLRFQSKQKLENFRVLTGDPSLGSGAADQKSLAKSTRQSSKSSTSSSKPLSGRWTLCSRKDESSRDDSEHSMEVKKSNVVPIERPINILSAGRRDPFGTLPINTSRVDILMDSHALRPAIAPLFSVDNQGPRSLHTVFPEVFRLGLSDPAFFHALLSAIVFTLNGGEMTSECLAYKAEAIKRLNDRLQCPQRATSEATIGTIMILTGVEYRMGNRETHYVHMQGLYNILNLREVSGSSPREGIKRALFWSFHMTPIFPYQANDSRQDLDGAVMSGTSRLFTHETFPELHWDRGSLELFENPLPPGFVAHADLLDSELLSIVTDIDALRESIEFYRQCDIEYLSVTQIDNAQASIESRLFMLQETTKEMGPVAECCRLATYICSYVLFMEIWNTTFIPVKLSSTLRRLLLQTCMDPSWDAAPDMLLWVLFVGGAFSAPGTTEDYVSMLQQLGLWWETWEETERLLQAFIWVERALRLPCQSLSTRINACPC